MRPHWEFFSKVTLMGVIYKVKTLNSNIINDLQEVDSVLTTYNTVMIDETDFSKQNGL